ncbi:MAG: hypothetical protein M3O22_03570 [Pseudomonadota bacterium]|nr:hypothetical protein [Pseudomonadota bacterium]
MHKVLAIGAAAALLTGCTDPEEKAAQVEKCLHGKGTDKEKSTVALVYFSDSRVSARLITIPSIVGREPNKAAFRQQCLSGKEDQICVREFSSSTEVEYTLWLGEDGIFRVTRETENYYNGEYFLSPVQSTARAAARKKPSHSSVEGQAVDSVRDRMDRPFTPFPELKEAGLGEWYFMGINTGTNSKGRVNRGSRVQVISCAITTDPDRLPSPFDDLANKLEPEALAAGYKDPEGCDNLDGAPSSGNPFRNHIEEQAETFRDCIP